MRLANLQYTARPIEAETLSVILPLLAEACAEGADLVALPECATIMAKDRNTLMEEAGNEATSRGLSTLREAAAKHQRWLLIGSLLLNADSGDGQMVNRSFLISPDGAIHARYDKIHMFDAELGDGQHYRESDHYIPGTTAMLAHTPLATIGMTICYDLRFPGLYRTLAEAGAQILAVPSAFTRFTGAAHWQTLLRARAIENSCFVMAPAQTGTHDGGRQTWGHSLIINPWGEILADGGEAEGISMADINLADLPKARHRIPSITGGRAFTLSETETD